MAAQTRKCPRCGHENVPRAQYCFQCGRDLNDTSVVDGAQGTGKLVADAMRFIKERGHTLEPSMIARLKEARAKVPPMDLIGEPLTCLNCGTLNHSDAKKCASCGLPLVVADEDFNLLARSSARTSMGQVRRNNEDSVGLWGVEGVIMALIADGMGGAAAGEEASRLAVEAVQADFLGGEKGSSQLLTLSENELGKRLTESIQDANRAVLAKSQVEPLLKGMGTTSTLLLIRANRTLVAHVGDSRAYHIDGKTHELSQVTSDHSFVQALVASGHITADQARSHPMGNVLYRALGQSYDLDVDLYTRYLRKDDRLILCSDGLTLHLLPEEIAKIVLSDLNPHVATQRMIELANSRGGEDNISVIVIRMADASSEDTLRNRPSD